MLLLSLNLLRPALAVDPEAIKTQEDLEAVAGESRRAVEALTPEKAKEDAAKGWSSLGAAPVPIKEYKKPPKTQPKGLKPAKPNVVIGRPGWYGEPKNPLTKDGKPKPRGIGFFMKLLWAVAGLVIGGGIGFLFGGLLGAAIGGAVAAAGAWFLAPK